MDPAARARFIDPEGYRAFIDSAEAEFGIGVVHQLSVAASLGAERL